MLIQWCSVQLYIESKCWNAYSEFMYMYFIKGLRFLIHHYIRYQWQDFSIDLLPLSCYPGLPIFSYWFRAVIRVFMHYPNVANIFVSNHFTPINVLHLRILYTVIFCSRIFYCQLLTVQHWYRIIIYQCFTHLGIVMRFAIWNVTCFKFAVSMIVRFTRTDVLWLLHYWLWCNQLILKVRFHLLDASSWT